jgi:hypothetical protein
VKQRLAVCNPQIVRGVGCEYVVVMGQSIDRFTDKLLQEVGHRAARPLKSRLKTQSISHWHH